MALTVSKATDSHGSHNMATVCLTSHHANPKDAR